MSHNSNGIEAAKQRKHARFVRLLLACTAFIIIAVSLVLSLRGTEIVLTPIEVIETSSINIKSGLGFTADNSVWTVLGAEIQISAPGFYDELRTVGGEKSGGYVKVDMKELPSIVKLEARLATESIVDVAALQLTEQNSSELLSETQWLVGGLLVNPNTKGELELAAGGYEIQAINPYFDKDSARQVSLRRGEPITITVPLRRIMGRLDLSSAPHSASIEVNQNWVDNPFMLDNFPSGIHKIKITLPGYSSIEETLKITQITPSHKRSYRLIANSSSVALQALPKGGQLFLNGKKVSNFSTQKVAANAAHQIHYDLAGYTAYRTSVILAPNESRKISIDLDKNIGTVLVNSNPVADVFHAGKKIGSTPLSMSLVAIPQEIEIRKTGFRTQTFKVLPDRAETKSIDAELEGELAYRQRTSPSKYLNSTGIEMRLYKPDGLTMGAARSEKGWRGNEFVYEARLTKQFYVSTKEISEAQFSSLGQSAKPATPTQASSLPKVEISWISAVKYCNQLSKAEKLTPVYRFVNGRYAGSDIRSDGYRLLTEAEWEWLARKARRQRITRFTWGSKYTVPESAGNFSDESAKKNNPVYIPGYSDGYAKLAPTGSFNIEKSGLFDMSGNVSEWVHDFYSLSPPSSSRVINPTGAESGISHVIKGSSWRSSTSGELRAAWREGVATNATKDDLGFRVARYLYGRENEK